MRFRSSPPMADLMSCRTAREYPPRRISSRHGAASSGGPCRRCFRPCETGAAGCPPRDDYLRRDIGLEEREMPREYWEYWWHHR
ncbi:hypothetical protein ABID26_005296 [Mesorhizobium shonense]|uniref:Uncharacterized protein n=1 Tax=Mesorhizobium shonense TaxID=1209948 RepID=A0ABV2HZ42_9HYPH